LSERDYSQPGAPRLATWRDAPSGRAPGTITLELIDAATGITAIAATAAGIVESPTGAGTSTYSLPYTAPKTQGLYLERWRDTVPAPDVVVDDELEVTFSIPDPVAPGPLGVYAVAADLRARLELDAVALPDAAADTLLRAAERRLDRLAGAWPIRPNGRKLDPTSLPNLFATAIREATLDLAAAEQRNPAAFTMPGAKSVIGPDFRLMDVAGLPPDGQAAIRDAVDRLDALNLRALTARARP
jgi:hypothetical protein